jgi:hypothetical protein
MKGTGRWGSACSEACGWCGACTGGPPMIRCAECDDWMPLEKPEYDAPPILRSVCDRCFSTMNEREERKRYERNREA